jgi:proton glutamate symport protein
LDPALVAGVEAVVRDTPASRLPPIEGPATLDGIRERKTLRVGYGRDLVPFTYKNRSGDLVGFDISYAYRLARDLHVRLELAPIEWDRFEDDLIARRLDIVMAGVYVTDKRLEDLESTNPYFESPLAFIARSDRASRFLSYSEVAGTPNLALGVLGGGALFRLTEQLFPKARIVPLETYDALPVHRSSMRRFGRSTRPGPGPRVTADFPRLPQAAWGRRCCLPTSCSRARGR